MLPLLNKSSTCLVNRPIETRRTIMRAHAYALGETPDVEELCSTMRPIKMTLRIVLSIVPYGIEEDIFKIGHIEIWNLGKNSDGKYDHAVVQLKHEPFRDSLETADSKGLVYYSGGVVIGVKNHDDEAIRIVHVYGHNRASRDAYDLLYRALVVLGYRERNPDA